MSTNIFLGYPPENIKQFIIDNYSPKDMTKIPLHFTANEDGSSVSLVCEDSMKGEFIDSWCEFQYSMTERDDDWKTYETGSVIDLNEGETVYFRCPREKDDSLNQNKNGLCQGKDYGDGYFDLYKTHHFVMEGSIKADGNIQFLLENTGTIDYVPVGCYLGMFIGCTNLTQAPVLPAETLDSYCYGTMFFGCTNLTQAPALPAETLANVCYSGMFNGCTSLTQAPELPATTLAEYCYDSMFAGCTNLTQAPALPAETLARKCYIHMFGECSSLPEPKYDMSHMTFDEVTNEIQNTYIFGEDYYGDPIKVQCSDKILVATFDDNNWQWIVTEG